MKTIQFKTLILSLALGSSILLLPPTMSFAHCDGLDGPVVTAARKAIETGDVRLVLLWVQKSDEAEIRDAFEKTIAVRKTSPQARELADMYFFETLVRIHRAGEGFPYTGLKPAQRDLGPAIPAGDKAIQTGAVEPVLELLTSKVREGIEARFHEVLARSKYSKTDVPAGREFVKAYVQYIHYIEELYNAAAALAEEHEHASADVHPVEHRHE